MSGSDPPKPKRQRARSEGPKDSPEVAKLDPANDHVGLTLGGPFQRLNASRWAKMPFWTLPEAACITMGYEPKPILEAPGQALDVSPATLEQIDERADLIYRAIEMGIIDEKIVPIDALKWLEAIEESVPPDMLAVASRIRQYGPIMSMPPHILEVGKPCLPQPEVPGDEEVVPKYTNLSSANKVISTLRKYLLATVVDRYDYNPDRHFNSSAKRISGALTKIELSGHEDNINHHLKAAVEEHWTGPFE